MKKKLVVILLVLAALMSACAPAGGASAPAPAEQAPQAPASPEQPQAPAPRTKQVEFVIFRKINNNNEKKEWVVSKSEFRQEVVLGTIVKRGDGRIMGYLPHNRLDPNPPWEEWGLEGDVCAYVAIFAREGYPSLESPYTGDSYLLWVGDTCLQPQLLDKAPSWTSQDVEGMLITFIFSEEIPRDFLLVP